jgi:hypothetical protein
MEPSAGVQPLLLSMVEAACLRLSLRPVGGLFCVDWFKRGDDDTTHGSDRLGAQNLDIGQN